MTFRNFLLILPLLVAVGCGGNTAAVTGTVKLANGSPLTSGLVTFESATTNVVGNLDSQGRFSLFQIKPGDRVPVGTYRGSITTSGTPVYDDKGNELPSLIPAKYSSLETSGLSVTVEHGKPVHLDIILE